jgi:Family of unknown function (DUF5670)
MLWTLFAILLVLWLLGLVTSYTLGGFVHILFGFGGRRSSHQNRSRSKDCLMEVKQT